MAVGSGKKQVSVTVDEVLLERIDVLAEERGVKRAELLTRLVLAGYGSEVHREYTSVIREYVDTVKLVKDVTSEERDAKRKDRERRIIAATAGIRDRSDWVIARADVLRELTGEYKAAVDVLKIEIDERGLREEV